MVWADVPMNQGNCWQLEYIKARHHDLLLTLLPSITTYLAKSNVVNGNSNSASSPPQLATMQYIRINQAGDTNLESDLAELETFIRNQAALGECQF